jgi:DNA transposition AAA+ family ATPase
MDALGRMLGYSGTVVSKYLSGVPEGDVATLEAKIADVLKAAARRGLADVPPFETTVTRIMTSVFELVRKTSDVALISGPAGIGKTVACRVYRQAHPTTLAVEVTRWRRDDAGLAALLWDEMETAGWTGQVSRAAFMAERLRGSDRLLIVDNAHRMAPAARAWLFDFHDATGCPVALVGNPEILQAIRGNDQQFSRIGIHQVVGLDRKHAADYARQLVDALVPEPPKALYGQAAAVAAERGHLRALRKQLLLAADLAATPTFGGDLVRAFSEAHRKLVRDYEL